ncbi:MAG: hypothetical protein WKF97_18845 [Chitinophagaceae bacterium]
MKSTPNFTARMFFLLFAFFVLPSCEKIFNFPLPHPGKDPKVKKVHVSTVNELYAAINDPSNAGSQIVLAPGTYTLAADRPNGGRLELQHDMKLQGQAGHPERVIIDASALPASSVFLPLTSFPGMLRTGGIRTGRGSNAIEWLTLIGNANALSVIDTDLNGTPTTYLKVAHCIIKDGRFGIDLRNRDEESNGRIIEAEITDNELMGFVLPNPNGVGIAMQNSRNVHGAAIRAKLGKNYIHGNMIGIAAYNVVGNQCRIEVASISDRIEANGLGLSLWAGLNQYPNFVANDNAITFAVHGAIIRNNQGTPAPVETVPGGIAAFGGQVNPTSLPGTVNNNVLNLSLWDCQVEGNLGPYQINAFGARSLYTSSNNPAGTNNVVNIDLHGVSKGASVNVVPSLPTEPAGTNKVNVYR